MYATKQDVVLFTSDGGTIVPSTHGLRTPNEGINQKYLKNWAGVADKICFGHTEKFKIGIEFSAVQ